MVSFSVLSLNFRSFVDGITGGDEDHMSQRVILAPRRPNNDTEIR